jgi:predicted TIM-barrel fold metal-dependent hydrolase
MTTRPTHIIDSHQHVFWHGRDDAGLIADMDEHGIQTSWLLSWEIANWEDSIGYHGVLNPLNVRADGTHEGIPLRDLLKARDNYPDRLLLGYCPHPMSKDAPALLQSATKIYGVQVCGEWKFRIPFDDPRCLELFHAAGELNLPVVLHLDVPYLQIDGKRTYQAGWYGGTVDNLERALQACPNTTFIGHAPGFWREISGNASTDPGTYPTGPVTPGGRIYDLFDQHSNLYADLSAGSGRFALARDPEHAVAFIERFSDRLLFARDYYGGDLDEFLMSLDLPSETIHKLYYANAHGLLGGK